VAPKAPPPIPEEALALFGGKLRMGYVATARADGHLAVVPVGVVIHDGLVKISSPAPTRKIGNLKHNPHIAVCVPDPADGRRYLMVRGLAEVAEDADRAFLDWLARTHMGMDRFPREEPELPRVVITIANPRYVLGGTFGEH
jgi:PPOX class probable F420-dependent enzyme